jgi:hypothetical protein
MGLSTQVTKLDWLSDRHLLATIRPHPHFEDPANIDGEWWEGPFALKANRFPP